MGSPRRLAECIGGASRRNIQFLPRSLISLADNINIQRIITGKTGKGRYVPPEFDEALGRDLNMPQALADRLGSGQVQYPESG